MSRRAILGALAVIIAIHVAISGFWMHRNGFFDVNRPPFHDCAYFRLDALAIKKWMHRRGPIEGTLKGVWEHNRPHPPLLAVLNAYAGLPEGRLDTRTQWYVQAFYLAALVVALYLLGREVLGAPGRALFFSLCATAAPVYVASARVALPKFPMMVTVFFALHALLRSRGLARRGWSLAFGFWTGTAVMTMMLAPLYLAGSALAAFVIGLRRGPWRGVVVNALLATAVAAVIMATWYVRHWESVSGYARLVTSAAGQKFWSRGMGMWSVDRWLYYPAMLVNNGLGFFLAAAAVFVMILRVVAGRRRSDGPPRAEPSTAHGWVLGIGAVVSLVVVARGQVAAQSQYIMNLPALVLLAAHACAWRLRWRWLSSVALGLLAAASLVSAAFTLRPIDQDVTPEPRARWELPIGGTTKLAIIASMDTYGGGAARAHGVFAAPVSEAWPVREVVDLMERTRTFDEIRVLQARGASPAYMTHGTLKYEALARGYAFWIMNTEGFPPYPPESMKRLAREAEFFVSDATWAAAHRNVGTAETTALAGLVAGGAALVPIFEREVTPRARVVLYRITHPDREIQAVGALPDGLIAEVAEYDSGWRLEGFTHVPGSEADSVTVTTYWKPTTGRKLGFDVLLRTQRPDASSAHGWGTIGDSRRALSRFLPAEHPGPGFVVVRGDPLVLPRGGRLLLVMPAVAARLPEAGVTSSTLRDLGPKTLVLLERSAAGDLVTGRKR